MSGRGRPLRPRDESRAGACLTEAGGQSSGARAAFLFVAPSGLPALRGGGWFLTRGVARVPRLLSFSPEPRPLRQPRRPGVPGRVGFPLGGNRRYARERGVRDPV